MDWLASSSFPSNVGISGQEVAVSSTSHVAESWLQVGSSPGGLLSADAGKEPVGGNHLLNIFNLQETSVFGWV